MSTRRFRRNSDNDSYQFSIYGDGRAMSFGPPPYSLNRYEQSSNTASDVTMGLDLWDRNTFWISDDRFTIKEVFKI